MTKSRLGIVLSKLKAFQRPKVRVEQYPTEPEIAASVLWNALYLGDISGKVSVDLGCGTGILGIGALILGGSKVYFVDNDEKALNIAKINYEKAKSEGYIVNGKAVFILGDIKGFKQKCDVVLQNPPFGTKVRHADKVFLEKAVKIAPVIYSFHKSETSGFVEAFSADNNYEVSHIWDFDFALKQTMEFHKKRIARIKVSCFRLVKEKIYK